MFKLTKTKQYWLIGIIAIFMLFVFVIPNIATAEHEPPYLGPCNPGDIFGCDQNYDQTHDPNGNPTNNTLVGFVADTAIEASGIGGVLSISSCLDNFSDCVLSGVANTVLTMFGWLLGIAGFLLNFVIKFTVEQMGIFIKGATGIKTAWGVIRDVANIAFIFALVYIGISTILQLSGKGIKDLLVKLIIAALLVNFSFFFTGFIIDASNILTLQLYNKILDNEKVSEDTGATGLTGGGAVGPTVPGVVAPPSAGVKLGSTGISGIFMQELKIQSLYDANTLTSINKGNILLIGIAGSVLIFILIFVFLIIAALLLVRLIAFIFLLILSPIGYIGWAFPGMKSWSDKWWKALWGQALFAPIYMLLTLMIITVITDDTYKTVMNGVSGTPITGWASLFDTASENIGATFQNGMMLIVNYVITIGLVIGSVFLAKESSESSAGIIKTAAGKATGYVDTFRGGTQGAIGRRTVGALSERARKRLDKAREEIEDGKTPTGPVGTRLALRALSTDTGRKIIGSGERAKFGSSASRADVVKEGEDHDKEGVKKRAGDPKKQVAFIANLSPKAQQKVVGDMSSAKNRAVVENELTKRWGAEGASKSEIKDNITKLRTRLNQEEKDKTDDESRKVKKSETSKQTVTAIEEIVGPTGATGIVNPRTGVPYASVFEAIKLLPDNEAYKLSNDLLAHNDVVDALTPRHLGNIMEKKGDLEGHQIDFIRDRILGVPPVVAAPGTLKAAQQDYIEDSRRKHYWGVV